MLELDELKNTEQSPRYERHAGLHVLRVSGDDYEMGHQHGSLLREAVRHGPLTHFDRYVERMIASGLGPRAGAALAAVLRLTVGRKIAAGFPSHARRALEGLADGSGLDRRELLGAVTMPETYLWLLQRVLDLRRPGLAPRAGVPLIGCTSALAWGDATKHGKLLHGRNFDYQGVGAWDREQAVIFHRPKQGMPYVSVAAAGILFGGITAMNSAGLTLVVHQHMASRALELGGTPIGITGDQIMRHAHSLDDARRILDQDTPNGCWTYVIGSAREQGALCYETSPRRRAVIRANDDVFAYANVYLDAALGATEHHLYPAHWRNNLARLQRARWLLAERRGQHDPASIAAILGDLGAPGCRFESGIAMLMTVASVVFRPADGVFFVATGRAPVSTRQYVAFDLAREAARPELAPLAWSGSSQAAREAFDAYRDAYEAYFDHADLTSARALLTRATELDVDQALYHFVAGTLALLDSDPAAAERAFDTAIRIGHALAERKSAFHLWRARARDLRGRRKEALADYRVARSAPDRAVRDAASRGLRSRWRARRFGVEFSFADVPVP
jgi:hypothetical protein